MSRLTKSERDSLAFFVGFEKLMDLRRERGISLEKMSQMIGEIAEVDAGYIAVTEDELRAVEQDPMHGISMAAVMYARLLGGKATAVEMEIGTELRQRMVGKKAENRKRAAVDGLDALMNIDSNGAVVTHMIINYVAIDGAKKQVYAPLKRSDPEWDRLRDLFVILLNRYIESLDKASEAYMEAVREKG